MNTNDMVLVIREAFDLFDEKQNLVRRLTVALDGCTPDHKEVFRIIEDEIIEQFLAESNVLDKLLKRIEIGEYQRVIMHHEDGKFQILVLLWGEGSKSYIHGHNISNCFMSTARGCIEEDRWKEEDSKPVTLRKVGITVRVPSQSLFIKNALGVHSVKAGSGGPAASIHIYSPPITGFYQYTEIGQDASSEPGTLQVEKTWTPLE